MFRDDLRDLAKSSNGRKIARIAPISKIFCRNRPRRPELNFEKKKLSRRDRFRQKIVKIKAIVTIFRPFEDFATSRRLPRVKWSADLEELWIFERYQQIRLEKLPQTFWNSALYDFWWRGKQVDFDFFLDFWAKTDLHFFGLLIWWYDDMMIWCYDMMIWW